MRGCAAVNPRSASVMRPGCPGQASTIRACLRSGARSLAPASCPQSTPQQYQCCQDVLAETRRHLSRSLGRTKMLSSEQSDCLECTENLHLASIAHRSCCSMPTCQTRSPCVSGRTRIHRLARVGHHPPRSIGDCTHTSPFFAWVSSQLCRITSDYTACSLYIAR